MKLYLRLFPLTLLLLGCTNTPTSSERNSNDSPQPSIPSEPDTPTQPVQASSCSLTTKPTRAALDLLKKREGFSKTVYVGHNGKPTAGLGHVLRPSERQEFTIGSTVPSTTLQKWSDQDTAAAWRVAMQQAGELQAPCLGEALFAVSYQLGIQWHTIHKQTWRLLKQKRWSDAAREAQDSGWYRQTPLRVKDFQQALRRMDR